MMLEMATELDSLRQAPYFASLDDGALAGLVTRGHVQRYQADDLVLLEGERCSGLCVVLQGRVKVCKSSVDGREQVREVARLLSGIDVSEHSLASAEEMVNRGRQASASG